MPATIAERIEARKMAREAWAMSGHDPEVAAEIFKELGREKSINPDTIYVLLQIALELYKLWREWKDQDDAQA